MASSVSVSLLSSAIGIRVVESDFRSRSAQTSCNRPANFYSQSRQSRCETSLAVHGFIVHRDAFQISKADVLYKRILMPDGIFRLAAPFVGRGNPKPQGKSGYLISSLMNCLLDVTRKLSTVGLSILAFSSTCIEWPKNRLPQSGQKAQYPYPCR